MSKEWTKSAIVKDGGVVEVVVPDLHGGEHVEVVVRTNGQEEPTKVKRPGFGHARGRVHMSDDFDAPMEEFKDHI